MILNPQILDADRKTKQATLIDLYQGVQLKDLEHDLIKYTGNFDKIKPVCINITKKIINRLASTYRQPAKRTVIGSDKDIELFQHIELSTLLNSKLKLISRLSKLCKVAFLKVSWRDGSLCVDVISPELVDIETFQSPENITAITITIYSDNNDPYKTNYHKWTNDTFQILNHKFEPIHTEKNSYGIIPIVPFYDELPFDTAFPPVPEDLISLQQSINMKLADLCNMIALQSSGVAVAKGISDANSLSISPNSVISLPADTSELKHDFRYENTNAKIEETVAAIDKILFWAAMSYNLPASSISSDNKEASGTSKQVDNIELNESRQDNIELFRSYESFLFLVFKAVNNKHNTTKFSDACSLKVDFSDFKPIVSEKEQLENHEKSLQLGLTSLVNIVMAQNPDLTRDDAEAVLQQIQVDNATYKESY